MREIKINKIPFNPNQEKTIDSGRIPFNPIKKELRAGDANIVQPEYNNPIDHQVDSAIDFIKQKGGRDGSTIMDSELDVLKDVLKDPRATQEQRKSAILTIQGYDPKHTDGNIMYYNKREANGVYMPTALAYGEKPPQGYHVAKVWGNQEDANDNHWYTDLGKSLANGVFGAAQGVVDVAQIGTALVTGEESKYLNKLSNTADALKFEKDKDLNAPIFDTEGVTKFSDLLDKGRFDLSPKALWGSLNMATESLVSFAGGTMGATSGAKGIKGLAQGLKGIDTAIDLSKAAQKAAIFTGSFITQVGDVYDSAKEAGLNPRDAAAFSTAVGSALSAIDVSFGIDAKIMSKLFNDEKRSLFKNIVKTIEKDASGNITENGFKTLVKESTIGYKELAKNGLNHVVKDAFQEGSQEAAQEFTQKAGEHLWDKMSDDEKAKFGTNAFSAKYFGDYINSFSTGLVSGAPMAIVNQTLKNKHDEQSINAYDRVREGSEAVSALKADLATSVKNGDITPEEHDQAIFKIDSYQKYQEETKGTNLQPENERKAFELSFQIQGLKTEIPTNENEISKLDPISRAKIESKQKQAKELQSELNDVIRNGEIKGEPIIPKKEEERIIRESEKESNLKEKHKKSTNNRWEDLIDNSINARELDSVLDQMDKANAASPDLIDYVSNKRAELSKLKEDKPKEEIKPSFEIHDKPKAQPEWQKDLRSYEDVPAQEFNNHYSDARLIHKWTRKFLSTLPNKEMVGKLFAHEYSIKTKNGVKNNRTIKVVMEDGKVIKLASSAIREDSLLSGHAYTENIKEISTNENYKGEVPDVTVGVKVVDLNDVPEGYKNKMPNGYSSKKKLIKIYNKENGKFISWAKETNTGKVTALDKNGKSLYNEAEFDLMNHLKTINESSTPESFELAKNTPIAPPISVTKRAEIAKDEIVKENKAKIAKKEKTDGVEEKKDDSKNDGLFIKRKIEGYNTLSKKDKKSEFGVKLRKEIDADVKEFGGSLKSLNGNKVQLLNSKGQRVLNPAVIRSKDVIAEEKHQKNKRKNALDATPTSVKQYIAMVIGNGGRFDKSVIKEKADVPALMSDKENGYSLESLYQDYKEKSGLDNISEEDFNLEVENSVTEYFGKGGRESAIEYAIESYEKEINGGFTDKEINDKIAEGESLGLSNKSIEIIIDGVINLNEEEVTNLEIKAENINEKDRNEQFANEAIKDIAGEKDGNNNPFDESKSEQDNQGGKDIIRGKHPDDVFQKVSQRKGDFTKVFDKISANFKGIKVAQDASQFTGMQSTVAGKVSADGKTIYINPNYAGLDTPIHEAGHILIDAMGYGNKIIQSAIKQLRGTELYKETKGRYKELSEQELDKEVLAEAIGREGADIFDKIEDRSKFKAYLDYIFDWFKRKLGLDKNIAKSLAKQIIGGVKTKDLKGTDTGKEQLSKVSDDKYKKKSTTSRPLSYEQYASETGFSAEKEFNKYAKASVELKEAKEDEQEALINGTVEEHEQTKIELKKASKNFAVKAKKRLEYNKYVKDFKEIQSTLKEKDLSDYTDSELNDLITSLYAFNSKASKAIMGEAMLKFAFRNKIKQQEVSNGKAGVIESLANTSDISPLQKKILHHSHFSEKNADMQAVSLAYGKAIIDKIAESNSLKDTHEKLGLKVIKEENKRLGIVGASANKFSSDSAKYFEYMINSDGEYLTVKEAEVLGLSKAKIDYLKFNRETVSSYKSMLEANDFENVKLNAIRIDKGFMEAYKSEGLIPAFSYYLGGGATNLGRVRVLHNGSIKSYSEIEREILSTVDKKSITSIAKALYDLLVANIKARYQLKKGHNVDESENPLELKGDAEYSLNDKGQLVSKFDKPRNKDRGYSKDFYKAMNQFIDESAHVKHISKIMPLVDSVEYLNKNGYLEEGFIPKKNVSAWIEDWKALHIFKEPHVNDPVIDATIKSLRKLVASTTMWFNLPANTINVVIGNYNSWRQENSATLLKGNARLFGGKGKRSGEIAGINTGIVNEYALAIIKKYNIVNQDYDSNPTIKANGVLSKLATFGTQVGEYQIQGSLGLGLLTEEEFNSFEWKDDKYGNRVLKVKEGVDEDALKSRMVQIKNRVTDIQGKYPDEDRRNIMRGEFGKAVFQFKVWMPDWFKERFSARYINAYGVEKEGTFTQLMREGVKQIKSDIKEKGATKALWENKTFISNLKGVMTIGTLLSLTYQDDDDEQKRKGALSFDSVLSQILFILDLEQDKYMVSNPAAILGKLKDLISAFSALVNFDEDAYEKIKRVVPANKALKLAEIVTN